ncbi:MAG TPA: CDP-alcohol phosphatidyltransferase family protein [Alphaproteobacteria bacterium]|nr:CDP-alcohol phosphatidyltransferase family protein [Alphaproteobacteria bacterium]
MANLITLGRFLLLFLLVASAYEAPVAWQLGNAPLLLLIIALDGVDGYVARVRNETSVFGSIFDIAIDRVVENVLWVVLADLGLVPIWVAIVFITRASIVDSIRYAAISRGETAFGSIRSQLGRVLVSGRFMRGLYGVLKAATFGWVFFLQPLPQLFPETWAQFGGPARWIAVVLVYASVVICLLRALPVILEFLSVARASRPAKPARVV